MTGTAENYISRETRSRFRRQARQVWSAAAIFTFAWLILIAIAPVSRTAGRIGLADLVYGFFGFLCHQMPERSLHLAGEPLAVCSRCFGVYFGLFAGVLVYPLFKPVDAIEPRSRLWLFASLLPIGADWASGVLGIWDNTHLSRFGTGAILGAVCAFYIVPAAVELVRSLAYRRALKRAA
ncbi:MAG: DUF2085 domain-containing protein [Pyrinomonadaceae bacterium]